MVMPNTKMINNPIINLMEMILSNFVSRNGKFGKYNFQIKSNKIELNIM
jgi:hypothetical protein